VLVNDLYSKAAKQTFADFVRENPDLVKKSTVFAAEFDKMKGNYTTLLNSYSDVKPWSEQGFIYTAASGVKENILILGSTTSPIISTPEEGFMSYSPSQKYIARFDKGDAVYLDTDNARQIVPFDSAKNAVVKFNYLGEFVRNIAPVEKDGKWGYMNTAGSTAKMQYDRTYPFSGVSGGEVSLAKSGDTYVLLDKNFREVLTGLAEVKTDYYGACARGGVVFAKKTLDSKYSMYRLDKNADGTVTATDTGKVFDDADSFGDTYGAVKEGDKWGYVDRDGNYKIEPQYENARSFGAGLAPVQTSGKWNYIDENGIVMIDKGFIDAYPFNGKGYAPVKVNSVTWRFILLDRFNTDK
jgi:hypothetical protein